MNNQPESGPVKAGEGTTDLSRVEHILLTLRDWLVRHSQNLESRQPRSAMINSPTGTDGWSVAAIPDWEVRQKIDLANEALAALPALTPEPPTVVMEVSEERSFDEWFELNKPTNVGEAISTVRYMAKRGFASGLALGKVLPLIPEPQPHYVTWGRLASGFPPDFIGVRIRDDGRREYLIHDEALAHPYYTKVLPVTPEGTTEK